MDKYSSSIETALAWESPGPNRRVMGLMFERDITPTDNIAAGYVKIPVDGEQPKLSRHPGEELYFVVEGVGVFDRGDTTTTVKEQGVVYVSPFSPHRWINTGDTPLVLYWVNSPPAFEKIGGYKDVVDGWRRVH